MFGESHFASAESVSQKAECTREERWAEKMKDTLAMWSEKINDEFNVSGRNVIDASCHVDMRAFMTKNGGPYAKEEKGAHGGISIQADEEMVRVQECAHSGAREASAERLYGTTDEEEILTQWRAKEEQRDGTLAEAAVVALINKRIGVRFVAVRASTYDDYINGVDTVILDKETGGVICAFDELVGGDDTEKYGKKVTRAKERLAKSGGMRVRYGLHLSQDADAVDTEKSVNVEKTALPHVPGFCVTMTHDELHALLNRADLTPGAQSTIEEDAVFAHISASLKAQQEVMAQNMTAQQRTDVDALITVVATNVSA